MGSISGFLLSSDSSFPLQRLLRDYGFSAGLQRAPIVLQTRGVAALVLHGRNSTSSPVTDFMPFLLEEIFPARFSFLSEREWKFPALAEKG